MNVVNSPIIVALDTSNLNSAMAIAEQLDPTMVRLKVGKELFTHCGPNAVSTLSKMGFEIFLDLKFHDIPNTTAQAVLAAADMGVWMVNVHAGGGSAMMSAAANALSAHGHKTKLIAVTVLTSMGSSELAELGLGSDINAHVHRLASLAKNNGLSGVVCSARECAALRESLGESFDLVTPGIRPRGSFANDQNRIVTPNDAIMLGSSYLVIGRPITSSDNPGVAAAAILDELARSS